MTRKLPSIFDMLSTRAIGYEFYRHALEKVQFPPYNLVKQDDDAEGNGQYKLVFALAGFSPDDIAVYTQDETLIIESTHDDENMEELLLHRGIAKRKFRTAFLLSEFVEVDKVHMHDGLLSVHLKRIVPDMKKMRQIPIITGALPATEKPALEDIEIQGD